MDHTSSPLQTPSIDQQTFQTPPPLPNKKFPLIPLIGILIAFLTIFGIIYAYFTNLHLPQNLFTSPTPTISYQPSPTPSDPTANWKTYNNNFFSFKYPINWELVSSDNSSVTIAQSDKTSLTTIVISFSPISPQLTIDKYINQISESNSQVSNNLIYSKVKTTLDNRDAIQYDSSLVEGSIVRNVDSINNGKVYRLYVSASKQDETESIAVFDQILSTFRFLDQDQTIDTSNWKTYKNTRFKFSFRYPQALTLDNRYENKYPDQGGVNIYSKEEYEAVVAETPRGGGSFIEVWIYPNPQNLSLLEWMKSDTSNSNYFGQTYSPINIDGETGYIYTTEGMGRGLEAVVAKNKQIYMFADLGFDNELKQIISTFKFE